MLGGGAFGLRQLIHQVLTGKELRPGRKIPRSTLFDSEILFSNRTNAYCHGGSIAITTSLAPIPDLDIEASTEIEKYRDSKIAYSPSSDTTSSEDSSHSNSSRATVADSLSSSDIDHKPSLDLDIDDPFIDRSSVPKKDKLHPSIGLALDIPSRDADEMFAGNSPMLPKQTKKFDALSPVVDKKQHTAHNATKSKQVVDTSAVPNKHSEKVGRRASRARDSAQSGNSSSDINTTLRALQKSYKLKFADTRAQNEASQKPKSGEEYQRLKKTS